MKKLIKNYELIAENSKVDDLLDFSEDLKKLESKVNSISHTSIIGFVGKYGSGKSVLLHQLEKKKKSSVKWINFDAWKYNDKKDLWEGFVLDFAEQVSRGLGEDFLKKIEGRRNNKDKVAESMIQVAAGFIGPFSDVVKGALSPFMDDKYPATRVFQIQSLLADLIHIVEDEEIYIIAEDIDRSGEYGIYFLETLQQFLAQFKGESKKRIIVIAPIADKSYRKWSDSYSKCLDYVEFFNPKPSLEKFIKEVIHPDVLSVRRVSGGGTPFDTIEHKQISQIVSFFEYLFIHEEDMTPRVLKNILRSSDSSYNRQQEFGHNPDWRIIICIETSKYLYTRFRDGSSGFLSSEKESKFDSIVKDNKITGQCQPYNALIHCVSCSKADSVQVDSVRKPANKDWYYNHHKINGIVVLVNEREIKDNKGNFDYLLLDSDGGIGLPKFYLD